MDRITSETEPYEAPTIEDIPLRSEEQILAGCKTVNPPFPNSGGADCFATCVTVGSS